MNRGGSAPPHPPVWPLYGQLFVVQVLQVPYFFVSGGLRPPHTPPFGQYTGGNSLLLTLFALLTSCRDGLGSAPLRFAPLRSTEAALASQGGQYTIFGHFDAVLSGFRPTSGSLPVHFRSPVVPLTSPDLDESNDGRTSPNGQPGAELCTVSGLFPAVSGT